MLMYVRYEEMGSKFRKGINMQWKKGGYRIILAAFLFRIQRMKK